LHLSSFFTGLKKTGKRFVADRCGSEARSLSYISLVSLIPMVLTVTFALKAFVFFPPLQERFIQYLSAYFLPEKTQIITVYLESILEQSRSIGFFGTAAMVLSSFFLVLVLSKSVNAIWRQDVHAPFLKTVVKFFVIIVSVPVIVMVTAFLNYAVLIRPDFMHSVRLTMAMSLLLHWLLFALLLGLMPNEPVKFLSTLIVGVITGTVGFLLRAALDLYVRLFPQMNVLYGSLAFIPIFLLWVYLLWLLVLFGVELNYTFHYDVGKK
jgi:membrane protein